MKFAYNISKSNTFYDEIVFELLLKGYKYLTRNRIKGRFSSYLYLNALSFLRVLLFIFCKKPKDPKKAISTTKASLFTVVIHCCGSPITITLNVAV